VTSPHYDLVLALDPRFPGGTSTAISRELEALLAAGVSLAVVRVNAPVFPTDQPDHPGLAARIAEATIPVLTPGQVASCDLLVAHNPMAFELGLPPQPRITARRRIIIAHHVPVDGLGGLFYDPVRVQRRLADAFGGEFHWVPISEGCRRNLMDSGAPVPVVDRFWPPLVDVAKWGRPRDGLLGPIPVIGRHSRPDRLKWPSRIEDLRAMYPEAPDVRVRLLGYEGAIAREVGPTPSNWETLPFGAEPVDRFLSEIDFFVYQHHDRFVETFGLTIAEAMASGAVAILTPNLRVNFADAALFADPPDMPAIVRRLAADPAAFARQSAIGWDWVRTQCGPERYLEAVRALAADPTAPGAPSVTMVTETEGGRRKRRRHGRRTMLRQAGRLVRAVPFGGQVLDRLRGRG